MKHVVTAAILPIAKMIKDITDTTLSDLASAIKAKDQVKFVGSFDKLTAACNSCHQAARHGFIVIRRPTASAFANQSFSPRPK